MSLSDKDKFEFWLMDMDDALEGFIQSLPAASGDKLDGSIDSLVELESILLEKYSSFEEVKKSSEATFVDGASRYLGEIFRKELGGKWSIDFSDEKNVFYGVPQLSGFEGQKSQLSPQKLITASIDRRKGDFLRTILNNNIRNIKK
jgi:hypothetical protein